MLRELHTTRRGNREEPTVQPAHDEAERLAAAAPPAPLQQPAAPPGTVVAAQNASLAPGAWDGGAIGQAGVMGINMNNTLGMHHVAGTQPQKRPGDGVMVPCSACGAENQCAMVMGNRAQFTCGQCGVVVLWRPRQIWLRDQGMPMEKPIHPQPGETDGMRCCIVQ